jgi:hypothetical protein
MRLSRSLSCNFVTVHIAEPITKFLGRAGILATTMLSRRSSDPSGSSANFSLLGNSESFQNNINDTKEHPPPYLLDNMANNTEVTGNQVQGPNDNNPHALGPTSGSALLRVRQAPTAGNQVQGTNDKQPTRSPANQWQCVVANPTSSYRSNDHHALPKLLSPSRA